MKNFRAKLTTEPLRAALVPIVVGIVFNQFGIVPTLLDLFGQERQALVPWVYGVLFGGELPAWVLNATDTLALASLIGVVLATFTGLVYFPDKFTGKIGVEDLPIFAFYVAWWVVYLPISGQPVDLYHVLMGVPAVGLLLLLHSTAWYVAHNSPNKTTKPSVVVGLIPFIALLIVGMVILASFGFFVVEAIV
ncbi:hypothetical protein [Haloglomus salinum]|uniref:hypothetical protein n=1 Tax=Haloglomus salinum TaxID=2962673 RepID=UPI0020C995D2|nr:hypothetical protein [Haloglomus salinum]